MTAQDVYTCFMVDLAKSVETSKTHFNTVLKGRKKAGAKLQKRLAEYFGLSLEEMVHEGHNLLHSGQSTDHQLYPDKSFPILKKTYFPSQTQENRSLTDLALEIAAAAKRNQDDLEKWQSAIEAIGDGVVLISADDQVIEYQNQAFQDLFGGNSIGKKCSEIAACPAKSECPSSMAFETGNICRGRLTIDGKTISIIASPVRDGSGQIVRVVTTSRDVSDRQKMLDDVIAAEERMLGVISLLGLPVLIFDENDDIVFTNETFRELLSATDDDLENLDTLTKLLRPLIKDFDQVEIWMRAPTRKQIEGQITVEYKSGRKNTWTRRPIFSPSGRYLGIVGLSN
jgi:PAS domain-containing protein